MSSSTPQLSTLYQNCALDMASKVSLGLATGAALSFLIFRGPSARKVVTGLGAGFGAGHAWATCSSHLSGHPLQGGPAFPLALPGMDLIAFSAPPQNLISRPIASSSAAAPAAPAATKDAARGAPTA